MRLIADAKGERVRKGAFILKGIATDEGKPLVDVSVSSNAFSILTRIRDAKYIYSLNNGSYEIKTFVSNFYGDGSVYDFRFYKEGYTSKYIEAFLELPIEFIKGSVFTLELPIEMVPEGKLDSTECGLIVWSKEKKCFVANWYPCFGLSPCMVKAVKPPIGQKVTLKNVFFAINKSQLLPFSFDELNILADYLTQNINTTIEISGHTDNTGAEEKNKTLSEARAKAVADYLISKGIDKSRTIYKGYGSIMPVAKNDTKEHKQQNRRVEFVIKKKE